MKRTLIALVVLVSACGTSPTAPTHVDARQIIGPCWVTATLANGYGTVSEHYEVCPSVALVDSLGEKETVDHP